MAYSWRPGNAINGTTDFSAAEIKEMIAATRRCADLLEEQIERHENLFAAHDELLTKYNTLKDNCTCGASATRSCGALGVGQHSKCLIMLDDALDDPQALPAGPSQNAPRAPAPEAHNSANVATDAVASSQSASTDSTRPYILVLVDPRSHCFNLNHINAGQAGGGHARKLIIPAVTNFVRTYHQEFQNCRIKILAIANPQTLVDAVAIYARSGDDRPSDFSLKRIVGHFVEGFCDPNTRFITVDKNDDTNVEEEIAGFLEKAVNEASCKQIYLAASGNESYHRLLQSLPSTSSKIILLHHGEPDIDTADLGFPAIEFPGVFRTFHGKRPLANSAKDEANTRKIPVNASGYRLDLMIQCPTKSQLDNYDMIMRGPLSARPCTAFHLAQNCKHGAKCSHSHAPISPELLHTIKYSLRRTPCWSKGNCRQRDCFFGHHCPMDSCLPGRRLHCQFRGHNHITDTRIDRWIEGGSTRKPCDEPTRTSNPSPPTSMLDPPSMQPWSQSDDVNLIEL